MPHAPARGPSRPRTIGAVIRAIWLVGGGGFIGSVLRYALATAVTRVSGADIGHGGFPAGTLAVNVVGCLIIGILASLGQHGAGWSAGARLFLFTGILGGFTTFSAFSYETFELARTGNAGLAALNVFAQLALGLLAVWLGYRAGAYLLPLLGR